MATANTPFGPAFGANGAFKIDRNDFHVKTGKMVDNGSIVGNDLSIELNVESHLPKPPATPPPQK